MNRIKTQNIPAELKAVTANKTRTVEVSGEEFKKALQTLVGEEVLEEQETTIKTDAAVDDDEDVVYAEIPWNLTPLSILPDKLVISSAFNVDDQTQIELPQPIDQVMPEMIGDYAVKTDQLIEVEEILEQPTFILPEKTAETETLTNKPPVTQEFITLESVEIMPESIVNVTILENESDTQVISLTSDPVEITDPTPVAKQEEVTSTKSVEVPTTVEELISQTGFEVEVETKVDVQAKTESVDGLLEEIEISEPVEHAERIINPELSASGQLTQMKLTAAQPHLQTETVKVVPQEQLVQEIETMIVENLDGADQVEKVSTTRIQLTPKHLGELDIEIVMKNKELTARLVVEKAETKQWLEQKLTQLTNTLAEQDIKVEQFEIQVSNNQASFTEFSFNDNPFFKEQEQSLSQGKSMQKGVEEDPETEQVERTIQTNAGRLSIWV